MEFLLHTEERCRPNDRDSEPWTAKIPPAETLPDNRVEVEAVTDDIHDVLRIDKPGIGPSSILLPKAPEQTTSFLCALPPRTEDSYTHHHRHQTTR